MSQSFYNESPDATLSRTDPPMNINSEGNLDNRHSYQQLSSQINFNQEINSDWLRNQNPGNQMFLEDTNSDLEDQDPYQIRKEYSPQYNLCLLPTQEVTSQMDKWMPFLPEQNQQNQQIFKSKQNQECQYFSLNQCFEPQSHQLFQEYYEQEFMSFDEFLDLKMPQIHSQQGKSALFFPNNIPTRNISCYPENQACQEILNLQDKTLWDQSQQHYEIAHTSYVTQAAQLFDDFKDGAFKSAFSRPLNINYDQGTGTVGQWVTYTASPQSSQQLAAQVTKNDDIQQTINFSSISSNTLDNLSTSDPQDREDEEQIEFPLRVFRRRFDQFFLKYITFSFEQYDNPENISEEEYMIKAKKKFYKLPIQDIISFMKSFLEGFNILEPSNYILYQAVVFIHKTRYGQSQVGKKSDKQKKLEAELLELLPGFKIPENFKGNDFFNKNTKKLRKTFFKLDLVEKVWNQIMEFATEEDIFKRSYAYEEHTETFRKITAEFIADRFPLMLPQFWYRKFKPLDKSNA
eukprot:403363727